MAPPPSSLADEEVIHVLNMHLFTVRELVAFSLKEIAPPKRSLQSFHEQRVNACVGEASNVTFLFAKFFPSQSCSHSFELVNQENMLDWEICFLTQLMKEELEEHNLSSSINLARSTSE